jgi:hypothetical protein
MMQIDLTPISESRAGTTLHPAMAIATVAATILILVCPRKKVLIPFLAVAFLGAWGQFIYLFGVHFFIVRILIIAGLARVMIARDPDGGPRLAGGWNPVDTVFVLWVSFHALSDLVRHGGAGSSFISQSAFVWDWLGAYILARAVIRNRDDIFLNVKTFAVLAIVIGIAMTNEKLRSQNIFGYLRVNPVLPAIREGSIRAQAAFAHPILAGVAGATLMPLFWLLWKSGQAKKMAIVGIVGSFLMILASASSTPVMTLGSAFLGLAMWPLRKKMRVIRWGMALSLIGLHIVMKAPVWFLIARVDVIAGNSGYHRAGLIDQCIHHFSEWWLYGSDAMPTWGWDMWDLSNQFIVEADCGGIFTFICFVLVISRSFGRLGKARKLVEGDTAQEWFFWLLGITLLANAVSFFGISYQDQVKFSWCALLAIATAATYPVLASAAEPQPVPLPSFRNRPLQIEPTPAATMRKSDIVLKKI